MSTPTAFLADRRIGWIGAGRMGSAMAGRLLDAGVQLDVWNRTALKAEPLVQRGATAVEAICDLGQCDTVFVTVSGSDDLRQVATGPGGLLAGAKRPNVIVDCSTVSAEVSAEVRAAAATVGVDFLAAPVSGNANVVADGGASFIVSGPPGAFTEVEPLLLAIGKQAVYVGDTEQARLVKLCHNLYLGMMVEALVEVTSLAEKGGTPPEAFLDFLGGTVLGSEWVRRRSKDLVARDWTPTFTTTLLRKDFDLGLQAARQLEVPLPVGAIVHQLIQAAIGYGFGDVDFLSLYEMQAQAAAMNLEGGRAGTGQRPGDSVSRSL
jgi:3-hydroxyisobutyrate dehydrogenase-like beta-hydroxyacid dehydrogenase